MMTTERAIAEGTPSRWRGMTGGNTTRGRLRPAGATASRAESLEPR
ncbi:MAG TPA: hypothetical protein VGX25_07235 [Actinophytocola sp.]|nr:hypothetical protein [Actinophytocola sp.]HEV2779184.1 hypothetical protein [Actinophytocola sp.]